MNKKTLELGLKNTHFETPHGLDSDNHYTTAYELALLANYAMNNKTFSKIVGTKEYTITINGSPKQLTNTNELLGNFDGVYGIKTGFTNGANRCLVTACKRNNIDIICVVLGADTKKFRTQDSVKLINYIFNNFKSINIENIINKSFDNWKNKNLDKIVLSKSTSKTIEFSIKPNIDCPISTENCYIPVRKDLINNISVNIDCPLYFETPIHTNSKLGTINVHVTDYCNFEYYICNTAEIKHKSWNNYFLNFFKNYSNILLQFTSL